MAKESVPLVVLRSADSSSTSECKLRRTAIGGVVERSEFNVLKRLACAMIWLVVACSVGPSRGEPEERAVPTQFAPAVSPSSRSKLVLLSFFVAKDVRVAVPAGGYRHTYFLTSC